MFKINNANLMFYLYQVTSHISQCIAQITQFTFYLIEINNKVQTYINNFYKLKNNIKNFNIKHFITHRNYSKCLTNLRIFFRFIFINYIKFIAKDHGRRSPLTEKVADRGKLGLLSEDQREIGDQGSKAMRNTNPNSIMPLRVRVQIWVLV